MNQAHLHLLITHLPIFGSILGAMVLIHALWTRTNATKIAAYNVLILSALGAGISYLTGEAAEETVEHLPTVVEATIKTHEEFALYALISLIALGVAACFGLWTILSKSGIVRNTAFVVLAIAAISFGLVARTGYLGGQIRHTEVYNASAQPAGQQEHEADD
jgi:uncharacterized membrane protein